MGHFYSKTKTISFRDKSVKISPGNNFETRGYIISNKRLRSILNELKDSNKKNFS